MPQPLIKLNDNTDAAIMHIAVANGFPPEVYMPMVQPFMSTYQIVSLPPRALWGDESPPDHFVDWSHLADDLLLGIKQYQLKDVITIGHSFGGIASMIAAIREPEYFKGLVLLDPTILPPPVVEMLRQAVAHNGYTEHPLAQRTLRRRSEFDDTEQFYSHMSEKTLFKNWNPEALRLYAEYGLEPTLNGVALRWTPEWEAYYFSTMHLAVWETVEQLQSLSLPILIIRGAETEVYIEDTATKVEEMLPSATHVTIQNHGHLFPQSAPEITAEIIDEWIARL